MLSSLLQVIYWQNRYLGASIKMIKDLEPVYDNIFRLLREGKLGGARVRLEALLEWEDMSAQEVEVLSYGVIQIWEDWIYEMSKV